MKIVGIREAQQHLARLVSEAQKTSVVFTRHGRPVAVLRGVGGRSAEDVFLSESSKFWKDIEGARADPRPNLTHDQVKKMFGVDRKRSRKRSPARR